MKLKRTIDNVAVEPCDWNREATEYDLVCKELPCIINIESVEGSLVQTWEGTLQSISNRLLLAHVHPSCKCDTDNCCNDTVVAMLQSRWISC